MSRSDPQQGDQGFFGCEAGSQLAYEVWMATANQPVDVMLKRAAGGASYLFAVLMRAASTSATFTLRGIDGATVEVLGESRTLTVAGGALRDDFQAYAVHLYKITPTR
jgi:hypothetical protein